MEALVVLAIVVGGAAVIVALGAFLTRNDQQPEVDRPRERPGRPRSHVVGGLILVIAGGLITLVSCGGWATNGYAVCETDPHKSAWWSVESRGNALVVTSSVLEFESGTGGLFCEHKRVLRVQARARPSGGKPVFIGVGAVASARRYLGEGSYEIAASYFSLLETRRVGGSTRRLAPPSSKSFWRSSAVFPVHGADRLERMAHDWRAVGAEPFSRKFGTPSEERFWLVVMNADGSSRVASQLRYEVGHAPSGTWGWLIATAVGVGLVLIGVAVWARRPRKQAPA